jgi:hypothetical protein
VIDSCIGIDPGPATGMCFLDYDNGSLVGRTLIQADGGSAVYVLKGMLASYYSTDYGIGASVGRRTGSVEKFITGQAAGSRGKPAEVTRQLVMELAEMLQLFGYAVTLRPAADVKPWASDKRLTAAGVIGTSAFHGKLRDSFDAARHCLYGAHEAGIIQDPLIRKRETNAQA